MKILKKNHNSSKEIFTLKKPILIGHKNVLDFFENVFQKKKLNQALLFRGEKGIGKFTFSLYLSWNVFTNQNRGIVLPDNLSIVWKKITKNFHPNLLYINSHQNSDIISVEKIRCINNFVRQTNLTDTWKIIIIDPLEGLNISSANALLKILEEPPIKTLFILISHIKFPVIPTIRSRCQLILFKKLNDIEVSRILSHIMDDFLKLDDATKKDIIKISNGSVERAVIMIQHGGIYIVDIVNEILLSKNYPFYKIQKLSIFLSNPFNKIKFNFFIEYIMLIIHEKAYKKINSKELNSVINLSNFWKDIQEMIHSALFYNLDKKNLIIVILNKMFFLKNHQ